MAANQPLAPIPGVGTFTGIRTPQLFQGQPARPIFQGGGPSMPGQAAQVPSDNGMLGMLMLQRTLADPNTKANVQKLMSGKQGGGGSAQTMSDIGYSL